MLTAGATAVIMAAGGAGAQAAAWTNQADYPPGSLVTFNGDNSDGAGYQAGETVHVDVNGPGSIGQSCDATAGDDGAWSCQITLGSGAAAIGGYSYTATGQASGVSQSGTFTDSGCKDLNALGTPVADPNVFASFTASGDTATHTVKTPGESPSGGVPGLIEYCIYPGSDPPGTATPTYDSWSGVISSPYANHGYFDFERPSGNPTNLPFDGSTQTVGTATWSGGVPSAQTIVLHINDPAVCDDLYGGNPGTCFVLPGTVSNKNSDLAVTKTATPSLTRAYQWDIAKSADQTTQNIAPDGSATFNYTVRVTHDSGTDSGWQVAGEVTVSNPNPVPFSGVDVTDSSDPAGSCTVADGSGATIPANGSADFSYTCMYPSNPGSVTDTVMVAWDKATYNTPEGSASGTATGDFSQVNPAITDGSVSVTDTLGGTLGTVKHTDPSPATFTYSYTFKGDPAGTCTTHDNTATFTTSDTGTTGSASQTVKVCVGADLTVSKTATPSFTRTYNWTIGKTVTPALIEQAGGGTADAGYKVSVTEAGFTDSGWRVAGKITVTNPNDWEAVAADVSDTIDNGGTCAVTGGTGVTIPAGKSVDLPYTCTYGSSGPSPAGFTNTAAAAWDAGSYYTSASSATGTAPGEFAAPTTTVNKTVTPTDTFNGGPAAQLCALDASRPCTLTAVDSAPYTSATYAYTRSLTVPANNCTTYNNTSAIPETGDTSSASVKVCGPAKTGALTMGFWQNKNGQGIITSGASTGGVCNSGTWLRHYLPFQDLSATASCSAAATYVTNVIKAANASGSSMNAMLKGQMLATSLDVYFSDPSLGGNKISAPAPVGGVSIDLTKICKMIDGSGGTGTCSGSYENVSGAFGGATSMTVSSMLSYAAGTSSPGGATWYGNVKATQQLAKDAFDAVNNQVAFAP